VSSLPSTSTDSNGPLAALGLMLTAVGAFLLRKPLRQ
jgi:LPXTG-motif cell wall-anchored protein